MNKPSLHIILLIFIIILGFIIRVYRLSEIPPGFFADEASIGYNAYTLLTHGTDEYGNRFPIFFRALGEYKSPIQIYTTVPFIAVFGLHEFAVRLTSVFWGIVSIIGVYLLIRTIFQRFVFADTTGIAAAFLLAISPWHIHLSRIAFELMPYVTFTTLGTYFFLRSKEKPYFLFPATLCFTLAIYSYFPARLFIPCFAVILFFIYVSMLIKHKRILILNFLLALLLLLPLLIHMFSMQGLSRWKQVSIFTNPPNETSIPLHVVKNYISHFSLNFLFITGDAGMPGQTITRHSLLDMGELYMFQLLLMIFGIIFLIIHRKTQKKTLSLLLSWLTLYPLGSMLTIDTSAQATRSIIGVIPFTILSALGLVFLLHLANSLRRFITYTFIIILFSTIAFSFFSLGYAYFLRYPLYSSNYWGWQYGFRPIMQYFKQQGHLNDQLLITHRFNAAEALLKFYNVTYHCTKCAIMANPIVVDTLKKQLFALRKEDVEEAKLLYPNLKFITQEVIYLPNKQSEFFIGIFE